MTDGRGVDAIACAGQKPWTRAECISYLDASGTHEHIKRHCVAVGDAAANIASALTDAGFVKSEGNGGGPLDARVVRIAGYLHDIARAGKDHDEVGGAIVEGIDAAAGDAVRRHMRLIFPPAVGDITEAEIVSLADRTVREDRYVGYEARMDDLLLRYADVSEVVERVHKNMGLALSLIGGIEALCGRGLAEIVTGGALDIDACLRAAERPGRYAGGELNEIRKDWHEADVRCCFAFPDLYEIGMSYTGLQILYGLLNAQDGVLCERVFAPAADMEALMGAAGLPLFALESRRPVRGFDIVGFTLQYELSYTNVVRMLKLAGIPLRADERADGDPFVVAGGPCCANPEPMAPFIDIFCIGDGEDAATALCECLREWKSCAHSPDNLGIAGQGGAGIPCAGRSAFLRMAAKIPGIYVPSLGCAEPVARTAVADLDAAFFPEKPVVPHIESVHDRAAVEIMRGCYRKCLFCQAGYACADVRRRAPGTVKRLLMSMLANTGYDEASLLSLSTGDYPGIEGLVTCLMDGLAPLDVSLSLPSLRLDSLKEGTLAKIGEYKNTALTFAPEAGTQRMRDRIGKQITEDDIFRALGIALPLGFMKYKLYFMIGLPGEEDEDLHGIAELARRAVGFARGLARERGERYNFHMSISVSNFVPKPGTPLERFSGNAEDELMRKVFLVKDALRGVKNTSFKYHDTRMSRIEMLLAKGDRLTAEAILLAAEGGKGFDSWREHFDYANWLRAFEEAGLPAEDRYAGPDAELPWGFIAQGKPYAGGGA